MLIMRDKRIVEKIDAFVGEFVLAYSFTSVEDDFSWAFAGIYGPNMNALYLVGVALVYWGRL